MLIEKVSNLMTRANKCAEDSKAIQVEWSQVELEIFSILSATQLRPRSAVMTVGDTETYFQLDWLNRKMIQVPKESVVIDIKRISDAGMILANSGSEDEQDGD